MDVGPEPRLETLDELLRRLRVQDAGVLDNVREPLLRRGEEPEPASALCAERLRQGAQLLDPLQVAPGPGAHLVCDEEDGVPAIASVSLLAIEPLRRSFGDRARWSASRTRSAQARCSGARVPRWIVVGNDSARGTRERGLFDVPQVLVFGPRVDRSLRFVALQERVVACRPAMSSISSSANVTDRDSPSSLVRAPEEDPLRRSRSRSP